MQIISRFVNKVNSFTGTISAVLLLVIVFFVFGNAVSRFAGYPLVGLFELTILGMVILTFIGSGYALKEKAHISVDVITPYLQNEISKLLELIAYIIILLYSVYLLWLTSSWFFYTLNVGMTTAATVIPIPIWFLVLIMTVGFLLITAQAIVNLVNSSYDIFSIVSTGNSKVIVKFFVGILFIIIALVLSYLYFNPIATIFIILFILILARIPISFAIGIAGIITLYSMVGAERIVQVPGFMLKAVQSWPLTAAPLFIFGGILMGEAGIVESLFNFIESFLKRVPSPLLIATIITGFVFCSITGSSIAAHAVIASLCLPVLAEKGYNRSLSIGVVGSSTVGTLIPPSTAFIMFAVITGVSLGKLFMAGIGPAVFLFGLYVIYVIAHSLIKKETIKKLEQDNNRAKETTYFWSGLGAILSPVIILGGIYLGLYTPTEGAGVFAVYALVCGFLTKKLDWSKIQKAFYESVSLSLMVLFIMANADVYSKALVQSRIIHDLTMLIQQTISTAPTFLLVLFFLLVLAGMFMDAMSLMVITLPVMYPVAIELGIEPLYMGVFYIISGEIALLTPPVGINIFVLQSITRVSVLYLLKSLAPFLIMMILTIVVTYLFPTIVTWLPSIMF